MREMKDSGIEWIGKIPKNWNISKMKYIVNCLDGQRRPVDASHRTSGEYPYWGAGSIQDYVDNYIFNDNLILLGEDGAPFFDSNRQVAFCVSGKIWVNNHIHVLKEKNGWDRRYVMYSLNSVDYKQYINGSILNKLTQGNMNNIVICAPSTQEQRKIADFLDSKCSNIDALISDIKSQIDILEQYKRSVITEAVTKGLNQDVEMKDSGVEWIGKIPKDWKICRLKDFCNFQTGTTPPLNDGINCDKDGIEWYTPKDLIQESINPSKAKNYISSEAIKKYKVNIFPADSILFVGIASIGKLAYIEHKSYSNQQITAVKPYDNFSKYIAYFLFVAEDFIKKEALYTTVPIVNITYLSTLKAPVPSLMEQHQIANYLDEKCSNIDAILEGRKAELATLKEYKKSLIYEYVTGKKEVSVK